MEIFTIDSINAGLSGLCAGTTEAEATVAAGARAESAGMDAAGPLTD